MSAAGKVQGDGNGGAVAGCGGRGCCRVGGAGRGEVARWEVGIACFGACF